ncbi:MAG: DNA-directed RNA polymerase subunit beta [Deltaproteobacteria bacterium]|nr:DNA-directed RNA polymerase subunit beta [Deltaproteobacteria bacterium]
MQKSTLTNSRFRHSFGKIQTPVDPPNLLEIQVDSYDRFLQKELPPDQRKNEGLEAVFRSIFPISDFSGSSTLEYVHYRLGDPQYTVDECRIRGVTYSAPLRVSLRLIVWEKEGEGDAKHIHDIKEQDIYLGELPLMTETGSFIINGTERVIVSQMHKSPGVFFDRSRLTTTGKHIYSARIIPQRGSWIDLEFDTKDLLFVRIDRKRKFHATVFLRALGLSEEDILGRYYKGETIDLTGALNKDPAERTFRKLVHPDVTINQRAQNDIVDPASKEVLVHAERKITRLALRKIQQAGLTHIPITTDDILGRYPIRAITAPNGDVLIPANTPVTPDGLEQVLKAGKETIDLMYIGDSTIGHSLRETLALDTTRTTSEALIEFYKKLKPGDPPTLETAKLLLFNMFFNEDRYSLSKVGRLKINKKLGLEEPLENTVLTKEDILRTVGYLLTLKEGVDGFVDDIDHLGNRRIRGVGELLENQFRIGLVRMERAVKERMSLQETESMMLHDIVNAKPVAAVINEFFGSSQLSQFMDQTNPLSEVTHKRRLSALGPGGLTRERAGFDVRDVHSSHYGRICPVETPEGPNIGLIASLATYARINDFGFIESPYRKVADGNVSDEIRFLSAIEEDLFKIAQANAPFDAKGHLTNELVSSRHHGEFTMMNRAEIEFMDVSPKQIVSAAASLIPFLEHDDANRALMGSNMQRQAVPLIRPQAPLVGTGMEARIAKDSGALVASKRSGVVDRIDSGRVVIQADVDLSSDEVVVPANVDIYHLAKYRRSNQNTCINQRPIVNLGQRVEKGDIIADGPSCDQGELALGQNLLVAFMPWNGYNFEDSILISERVVREDLFTSIHIEEFEVVARDTKLGKEDITRDIPNVSEEALRNLDDSGIVRIGTYVKPGDVLVGKVTPKGETQLNPEEKLLRAIFGEKAGDVRDTSLRVSQGIEGVVTNVVIFNRKGVEKDARTRQIEEELLARYEKDYNDEIRIVRSNLIKIVRDILVGNKLLYDVVRPDSNEVLFKAGAKITAAMLEDIPNKSWKDVTVGDEKINPKITQIINNALTQMDLLESIYQDRCDKLMRGDELPPGVIRMVKVYIAIKRKLSVGDKMAGRHGNKGVVSRIEPVENMPYMKDGRPLDIVLNPLGVPSRMNVGQVLETHLGWAAKALGSQLDDMIARNHPVNKIRDFIKNIYDSKMVSEYLDSLDDHQMMTFAQRYITGFTLATPVFDGAREDDVHRLFRLAGLPEDGQVTLYDGLTGDSFEQKVTVGYIYMLKLHHLVDDKIHARSIGPYSLVTQQPLGGKAQFGGQRFGEMEVWALQAYGSSYTLQELLTVKSDDIMGRNRIYEAIVKGNYVLESGIPEAFKVLTNELKSLCLDVRLLKELPPQAE